MARIPSGKYEPTMATSQLFISHRAWARTVSQLWKRHTLQNGGSGRSRLEAYQSKFRSKKTILWPRACRARVSERKVVAWPLPQAEVIERPKMTTFNSLLHIQAATVVRGSGRGLCCRAGRRISSTCRARKA